MSSLLPHSGRQSKKTEDNKGERKYRLCFTLCLKPGKSDLRTTHTFDAVLATLIRKNNSVIKVENVERNKHQKIQDIVYGLNKKSVQTTF